MRFMNIKHFAFFAILLLFCGCKSEKPTYNNENNKVVFAQSSYTFGVVNDEEWFEVPIVATSAMAHNQNMGVEVVAAESSAIEDMHFEMESHTVTIKEGERSSYVRIRGIAETITPNEPMIVKLNLIMGDKSVNTTYVTLQRCCEFDINNFAGYAVVTSTWSMQYMNQDSHLVHTHVDTDENVVVIENMFYEDYDIRVKLHSEDRLNPYATLCGAQVLGTTGEAFGTIYGNGKLMMGAAPEEYMSYYSTCENFLLLYTEMYVEEVGTVGYFGHILEWISDDEAERIMREGF